MLRTLIGDDEGLRVAAEKLRELADSGDLRAIEMLADRLDGKPSQVHHLTSDRDDREIDRPTLLRERERMIQTAHHSEHPSDNGNGSDSG